MAPSYEFPAPVLSVDVDVVRKLKGGEALTGLWTLFTKCKASIEDGHRLENISWRLWAATTPRLGRISVSEHDRNGILLVDTKNALRNEPGDNPEMEHIPSTHVPLPPYSIPTSSAYSHPKSPTVVDSISTRCNNSFGQIIIDMLPNPLPPITLQSCKESARNDSSQLTLSYFALNQSTAPALAADTHSLPIHCSLPTPTASERHLMPPSTIPAQNLPGSVPVPVPHVQVQVDPAPPSTPLLTLPQLVIVHPTPGPTPHPTPPASPILGLGTTSDHSQPIEVASVVAAAAFPSPKFTLHADGSTTSSSSDSSSTSGLTNTFSLSATTTSTNSRVTVAAVAQQTKPATDAAISLASGSDLSPTNIAAPPPPSASPTPYQPPTPAPAVRKVRSSPTARPSPAQALDPEPSRARPRAPGSLRQTSSASSTGGSSKGKDERSKSKSRSRSRGRGADGAARAGLTMTSAGGKRGLSTTGGAQRGRAVGLRKSASGKGAAARAIAREREREKRPTFNIGSHSDDVGSKSAGSGSSVSNAVNGTQKVEEARKEKQSTLVPPQRQQSASRMPPPLRHPLPDPATVLPSKRQQSKIVLATSDSDDYETETDITESDSEHGGDEAQRVVEEEGDTADWSSEDMSTDNVEFVRTQPALNQGKKGHIQPQHRSNSTAHITTPHHNNATHNRQRSAYLSRAQQSRRNHAANAQYVVEQAALEAERLRDMFAKKPVPSSEDLAKQRTQSVGLLTQLMHPNPEIFPPTHPYRRGHSSGDVKGTRGLGGLAMTSTSKNVNGNETRERAVMGQGQASTRKQNVQPPQRRASAGPAPGGICLPQARSRHPLASSSLMFYSETILSRRGPLGKVWLAAHMERKLSKTQTLQTDIEQSVDAIMGQEIEVMALRLSGQLLLGVVRIYSRKAKYLLDDCNEALLKIKMAFRPGIVDMTEDQLAVNKNAITLQPGGLDLDLLLPDVNWEVDFEDRPIQPQGHHQADIHDITLRTVNDFQDFDLEDPFGIGPSDGIGSQDFDVDLGLDWDAAPEKDGNKADEMSINGSVGVGRDAGSRRDSINSHLLGRNGMDIDMDILSNRSKSREPSEHPFDADVNMDFPDLAGMDLGDFGIGFDDLPLAENERTPGQTRASSRASSPLSEPPPTPPPDEPLAAEMPQEVIKSKRKMKEKKQIIDSVTELGDGPGAKVGRGRTGLGAPVTKDVSDILTEPQFLPRSSVVMRLLTIRDDPLAHFLPTKVTSNGTFFCAAPPGLAPELAEMFMRPINSASFKRRGASPHKSPNKRQRLNEDEEVEQGRRAASLAPSHGLGSDIVGRASMGPDGVIDFPDQTGGPDDFQLEIPEFDMGMEGDIELTRAKSVAPSELSRLSTPGPDGIPVEDGDETYADAACPIAMFDARPSQTQTQATEREAPSAEHEGKGYSKNTVKAVSMIRKELQPIAGQEDEDRSLSFNKLSEKASRRAAASFFFELLVLGTRDCLKLTQSGPFENIEIRAKDKLWEQQRHGSVAPSRFGSAAPSRFGSVAPSRFGSVASRHNSVAPSRLGSEAPSRGASVVRSLGVTMGL